MGRTPAGTPGRAFGEANRTRLIGEFMDDVGAVRSADAWRYVYRLLLWIDTTIGLAHCYESDKCQPGRPWYQKSLAFHDWLSEAFGVDPLHLDREIDWLFRRAVEGMAARDRKAQAQTATAQREKFGGDRMPSPGGDPRTTALIQDSLAPFLRSAPPPELLRDLSDSVTALLRVENKRKNLIGEGFEDTLAALIRRMPASRAREVRTRVLLGDIPGFNAQPPGQKLARVDLVLAYPARRMLVSAKWSIRADRERQFRSDFDDYTRHNSSGPFDHYLVTNEFDAARLKWACRDVPTNTHLFTAVVHVNPEGLLAAHTEPRTASAADLRALIETGRLISLADWLDRL